MTADADSRKPQMLATPFVASIAERDVDLVLLEELSVDVGFAGSLTLRVLGEPAFRSLIGALHPVARSDHGDGETDLPLLFGSQERQRVAMLIENKINAVSQPRQPERYRERGGKGVTDGL